MLLSGLNFSYDSLDSSSFEPHHTACPNTTLNLVAELNSQSLKCTTPSSNPLREAFLFLCSAGEAPGVILERLGLVVLPDAPPGQKAAASLRLCSLSCCSNTTQVTLHSSAFPMNCDPPRGEVLSPPRLDISDSLPRAYHIRAQSCLLND